MFSLKRTNILSQKEISPDIFRMEIAFEQTEDIIPGQFIDLYSNQSSKLLPRPISICDKTENGLVLVYRRGDEQTGTYEFSQMKKGDSLKVVGPLGNGYSLKEEELKGKDILLMGGGIGIPPMLLLSKEIFALTGKKPKVILGFASKIFLVDDFQGVAEVIITTDDGSCGLKGNVIDAVKKLHIEADLIYACGPMPMLKGVDDYAKANHIPAFVSLEERMACGIGACLGCITKTKEVDHHTYVNNTRICKEGPVFDSKDLIF